MRPVVGSRALIPDLEVPHYLNYAAIAPLAVPVRRAMHEAVTAQARLGLGAVGGWVEALHRLKRSFATLAGVGEGDLAFTHSTSAGIRSIALCFPWRPGDRVLLLEGEFPANVTPWQRAAALFGLELCMQPVADFASDPAAALERLDGLLARGVRLVAVSAVQFSTGLRMPIRDIAARCKDHGAQLFVDGIQACGVVPLHAWDDGADYLAVGGHKWLGGPFGTGLLAVRPEHWDRLQPHMASWLSHVDGMRFLTDGAGHLRYDRPIHAGPPMFEGAAFNGVGAAGLGAAVELLVELGIPAIAAHQQAVLDRLEGGLIERGLRSLRSPRPAQRSGILAMVPPAGHPAQAMAKALEARGVSVSAPDGNLRFAPHWTFSLDEVEPVIDQVSSVL